MLSSAEVRERYERIRREVGPAVTIVAATKYVSLADMAVLVEAGIEVVGENRAQDLEAKHAAYGDAFRWHFIGRLQSNKVKVVNRCCELVHSLDSHSAAERLEIPALLQVNLAGEASKGGVDPGEIEDYLALRRPRACRRCRPFADDPEASRPWFRAAARARRRARPRAAFDGHDAGLPGRRRGRCDARSASAASSSGSRSDYDP